MLARRGGTTMIRSMLEVQPAGTRVSRWGEGPLWWQGSLLHVDIEGHAVVRWDPASGVETVWDTGERVGTVVPRDSGGLLIATATGFKFLDETTGAITPVADPEADRPGNRFNDGKCSPDGRFFAGTMSLARRTGDARLYRLDPDLTVHEIFGPVTTSNGIGWSPDGNVVYYIDTPRREVLAFDYDEGHLRNVRTVVETGHIAGSPDGMAVDTTGRLWVAICHAGCVACFDPVSGAELERIEMPCVETTACAFGGGALDELYVTTGVGKDAGEKWAGRLLVVRGLDARGLPANAFGG